MMSILLLHAPNCLQTGLRFLSGIGKIEGSCSKDEQNGSKLLPQTAKGDGLTLGKYVAKTWKAWLSFPAAVWETRIPGHVATTCFSLTLSLPCCIPVPLTSAVLSAAGKRTHPQRPEERRNENKVSNVHYKKILREVHCIFL